MRHRMLAACLAVIFTTPTLANEAEVLALADRALELINAEDMEGFTAMWHEGATVVAVGERDGNRQVAVRSREQTLAEPLNVDLVERGWAPVTLVSGPIAVVWYPYDLYVDGEWLHCGIDVFNFVHDGESWKIASIVYSAVQPPACEAHPDGPPAP